MFAPLYPDSRAPAKSWPWAWTTLTSRSGTSLSASLVGEPTPGAGRTVAVTAADGVSCEHSIYPPAHLLGFVVRQPSEGCRPSEACGRDRADVVGAGPACSVEAHALGRALALGRHLVAGRAEDVLDGGGSLTGRGAADDSSSESPDGGAADDSSSECSMRVGIVITAVIRLTVIRCPTGVRRHCWGLGGIVTGPSKSIRRRLVQSRAGQLLPGPGDRLRRRLCRHRTPP